MKRPLMRAARALLLAGALLAGACCTARAATISIACSGVGQELEFCKGAAEIWARKTGNEVKIITPPNDASERLALYQQLLSAGSDRVDVLQIDVIWPGLLGSHLLDLRPYAKGAQQQHFPGFIANNTSHGRLVAMPWFANAGLLFYRSDLLQKYGQQVPETWDALTASARTIQDAERAAGNERMWGYVWQGRAYEGLSCNALEWVVSHDGGSIVEADGRISIDNPRAELALQTAAAWVGRITPAAVLNYAEEESRGVFQAGNAVFMRNWPYAWALAQAEGSAIRGKVGVAVLPKGGDEGRHAATLGGESLAVSKYSLHPAAAADLVLYMTSAAVQKDRALRGSFNPTISALYRDAEILHANPFMGELLGAFTSAVARPTSATGVRYNQVSHQFWNAAHDALSGRATPAQALARLETSLKRLSRRGTWR
ncbi:ABC transporter substrate-binding protein [Accumulibacter sp.]|uniref:ABC transporter substrate-binding protein n=1 Tax=Accumulibacter sp. TaxID=2053492 RepID=UPI0025F53553|nr:ABC transporter substrate-binding protein [Accumulibacter sp.]MCP5229444.1 ABC transporter substrate-binding protein [Accumulibacter sp.]